MLIAGLLLFPEIVFAGPWKDLKEKKQIRDYSIKVFLTEEGEGRVVITRKGNVVFELKGEDMSRFRIGDLNGDDRHNALIPVGMDITGRGIPNLVISEWTGGVHCCYSYHVFELGETVRQVAKLDVTHAGLSHFEDLNNDRKLEFVTWDFTFAYWKTSFSESPAPKVILEYRDGLYRLAGRLMLKPEPDKKAFDEQSRRILQDEEWQNNYPPVRLWATMLDLIYTGNADAAWKFFDKSWPAHAAGKDRFLEEFRRQLSTSPYWVELRRLNAGSPLPE
ncbi:MAG: hypothetical protein HZB31_08725 [Nitrospirae bacterium]|nr:hypothetical protein [Nitrospirota bacterium]